MPPIIKKPGAFSFDQEQFSKIEFNWNGLWILQSKLEDYVSDVVFYSVDLDNLLPVIPDKNDRRELCNDEQESFEKVAILDKRNIKQINVRNQLWKPQYEKI